MRALLCLIAAVPAIALLAVGLSRSADCQNLPAPPANGLPPGLNFPDVVSTLPFDVTFSNAQTIDNDQKAFDLFSWASFLALNWPAKEDGTPLPGKISDNPEAPRVWETFIMARQVFKKDGQKPDPWGGVDNTLRTRVRGIKPGQRVLFATTKAALSEFLQAGFGMQKFPPIADVNGMYVFYEMRLNRVEYDYLVSNTLYNKDGQTAFLSQPATIDFTKGSAATQKFGSVEIKSAWKQLGAGDDKAKFYTISAIRVDPVTGNPSPQPLPFGLVGLHIVTRTEKAQKWVWSTFEHVDNAPDVGEMNLKPHYNFNDPTKTQPSGGFGFVPPSPGPGLPPQPVPNPTTPTQITRVLNNNVLSSPWTRNLNATMQGKLTGTVWANYRLVTTQWPGPNGEFIPCQVTNTVAETYIQNKTAGSCMRCHAVAVTAGTTADGQKASANFSYLLQMAQPVPVTP